MERQTYTSPSQSLGFLLHQAAINWRRLLAQELRGIELTPTQFFMLGSTSRLTHDLKQAPTQKDIASNTLIDVNVISQVVRQLEDRGLLLRTRDVRDKRAFRLSLSPEGRTKLRQAIKLIYQVDKEFFVDVAQTPAFMQALGKIA